MSPAGFKLLFLALMGSGIPVAIAMAGSSLIFVMATGLVPDFVVIHRMVSGIDSFPLLAVPFFILAGNLMNSAGITNRIYNFALALVGWLRGGLGHVNVVGSMIFAGMSGTAIADAAGLGTIEIKAMKDHGYNLEFAVGVTAASATLGPIIPPSLPFVIYAMFANVSVGALFLAGILPGVVMALLMMATVAFFAHKNKWGGDIAFEWKRIGKALLELAIVAGFPIAIWLATQQGANPVWTVADRARAAARGRSLLSLQRGAADHDAGAADRRHDQRGIHRDRGCDRRVRVVAVSRRRLVSYVELEDADQGVDGHDRDDGHGVVHRGRGFDIRLDADGHEDDRADRWLGPRLHAGTLGVSAAGQRLDAVRRLLSGTGGSDYDSGSGADADRP